MTEQHEMRIVAVDFNKTIRFGANYGPWEEVYNAAGAVIGDEPEQFTEGDTVVGRMVTDMAYVEAVEIMIDEAFLGGALAAVLRDGKTESIFSE